MDEVVSLCAHAPAVPDLVESADGNASLGNLVEFGSFRASDALSSCIFDGPLRTDNFLAVAQRSGDGARGALNQTFIVVYEVVVPAEAALVGGDHQVGNGQIIERALFVEGSVFYVAVVLGSLLLGEEAELDVCFHYEGCQPEYLHSFLVSEGWREVAHLG